MNGLKVKDFVDESTYKNISTRYKLCIKLNKPISYDEAVLLDGTQRHWNTTILPVVDEVNGSVEIFGISKEFTKLVQTQEKLKLLNESLEEQVHQSGDKLLYKAKKSGRNKLVVFNAQAH